MHYPTDWTCRNCLKKVSKSRTCKKCGYPLHWSCKRCHKVNINSKTCIKCNYPLPESEAPLKQLLNKVRIIKFPKINFNYVYGLGIFLSLFFIIFLSLPSKNTVPIVSEVNFSTSTVNESNIISLGIADKENDVKIVKGKLISPSYAEHSLIFKKVHGEWIGEFVFDEIGEWNITVSIKDRRGASSENFRLFRVKKYCESNNECELNEYCDKYNNCDLLVCNDCQYIQNHSCLDYECCDDTDCGSAQVCRNNSCERLVCGECQYAVNHLCKNYECCNDSDCESSQVCEQNICKELVCDTGTVAFNHTCFKYECLTSEDCKFYEVCANYLCVRLRCDEDACEHVVNHECVPYECCWDSQCGPYQVCYHHECKDYECYSSSECGSGKDCINHLCQ